jgi:hypothetical protein
MLSNGTERLAVKDRGIALRIWQVSINVLNSQTWSANKEWPLSWAQGYFIKMSSGTQGTSQQTGGMV